MSQATFHALTVSELRPETDQALTVVFRPTAAQAEHFNYRAGQYLTLRFFVGGQEQRRAYSMCSAPHEDELAVTVKRVRNGLVSNYVADQLRVGDTVDVMPPQGRFLLEPDPAARRDIYLFGAGSGITPLMSILRTVLEQEPKSHVYLLYGNRDEDSVIFGAELDHLAERYAGQLTVEQTLSRPKRERAGGLRGFFGGTTTAWPGRTGRIDRRNAGEFLRQHPGTGTRKEAFLCGPGRMIEEAEAALLGHGFLRDQIHQERFAATKKDRAASPEGGAAGAEVLVKLGSDEVPVSVGAGQTILDALLADGQTPPYSCLSGACSTCMARVEKGGVRMDACYAIDDEEIAKGYILTCQAHPTTPEVTVDFNV